MAADRAGGGVGAPHRDQRSGFVPRKMKLREVGEVIRRIGRPEGSRPTRRTQVEHRDLKEALAKLPPKQAAAIVLRHYHGYTNRAIAQALGIPERTVASRLAIAKQRLRGMLSQSYGIQSDEETAAPRPESSYRGLGLAPSPPMGGIRGGGRYRTLSTMWGGITGGDDSESISDRRTVP